MKSTDQAWCLGQLQNLLGHIRTLADEAKASTRQAEDIIENLERRFSETITRERTE